MDNNMNMENTVYQQKNRELFFRQKKTLDMFLERGAISKAQHDKSLRDLSEKMGMADEPDVSR